MYQIDRNFTNIAYDNSRKVVNYTMDHDYKLINADELEADIERLNITTLNMDAEGVWYQLVNQPDFFKSWQAMTLASSTMVETEVLNTFYAYQAYNYLFNDE